MTYSFLKRLHCPHAIKTINLFKTKSHGPFRKKIKNSPLTGLP